jgi:hypothetical protein
MIGQELLDFALLGFAALMAGVVDAVIGGGGMMQLPALFVVYPTAAPAALFGTNKLSAAVGTTGAALQYAKNVSAPWSVIVPAMAMAFVAGVVGAYAVLLLPAEPLRKALPFILLALLIYTLRSRLGLEHRPRHSRSREVTIATTGSSLIGFYDGFFGAGTGAFYKVLFVRGLGYDFIHAAAPAKFTNVASNLGAVVTFVLAGQMLWALAAWMALNNFIGGQVGSRVALRYGSGFIRYAFIVVVSLLILKTFYDAYL